MKIATPSRLVASLAFAIVAAMASVPAWAGPIVFTSQSAFLAAVSNPGTDTFNDLGITATASPLVRTAGSYGYRASASTSLLFGAGSNPDHWLSTNVATDTITFDAFTGGVVAGIGGFFFGTDITGAFAGASSLTIVATDSSGSTTSTLVNPGLTTFLGYLSSSAITSLTVAVNQASDTVVFPTVNNLILAQAAVTGPTTVPEPDVLALVGLGLVAAMWRGRKRSQA
jgi:hypothetical protein